MAKKNTFGNKTRKLYERMGRAFDFCYRSAGWAQKDLFGLVDAVAIRGESVVWVQFTDRKSTKAHKDKAEGSPFLQPLSECGDYHLVSWYAPTKTIPKWRVLIERWDAVEQEWGTYFFGFPSDLEDQSEKSASARGKGKNLAEAFERLG